MEKGNIGKLFNEIRSLNESDENKRRGNLWNRTEDCSTQSCWKGAPKNNLKEKIPFSVDLGSEVWHKVLGYNIKEYFYPTPERYIEIQCRMKIYRFKEFADDVPITKEIPLPWKISFEPCLFGLKEEFNEKSGPWPSHEPIINNPEDLEKLTYPDFHKSGMMPMYHEYYMRISEIVPEDFMVLFPDFARAPFGVATRLRGMENFLMDLIINPGFALKLLHFITESRKRYTLDKVNFLKGKIVKVSLNNDDVDSPTISPQIYKEFLLPIEKEICKFQGGISYWHSCGNTTPFFEMIKGIPNIDLMHISPWADLAKAVKVFGNLQPLEIALDPVKDIQMKSLDDIEKKIKEIIYISNGASICLRIWGLRIIHSFEEDLRHIKAMSKVVQNVTRERY